MNISKELERINSRTKLSVTLENITSKLDKVISKSVLTCVNYFLEETNQILSWWNITKYYSNTKDIKLHTHTSESDISYVKYITKKWMWHHFMSHYFLYLLKMSWIVVQNWKIVLNNHDIVIDYDKLGLDYDIYLSYLAGIKLESYYFDIDIVKKNQKIIWVYFEQLTKELDIGIKNELHQLVNKNLEIYLWKNQELEQEDLLNNLRLADLLGLVEVWKGKDYFICWSMLKEFKWDQDTSLYESKPGFILEIIHYIFWENKTIKITSENYEEMKEKFKQARISFLTKIWVIDFNDQKEIEEKLQIYFNNQKTAD